MNAENTICQALRKSGFSVFQTGGGCTAWRRDFADGGYALVTTESTHAIEPGDPVACGFYSADGGEPWICFDGAKQVSSAVDAAAPAATKQIALQAILRNTLEALQEADEIGGADNADEYVELMDAVVAECNRRKITARTNATKGSPADYDFIRDRIHNELTRNGGAVLMWQSEFNSVDWEWVIENGDAVADFENDLYVHPKAIKVDGNGYTMPVTP